MKNLVSACLIVKDEESCIENCLKSIRNHVDEIVVIDTGSTDNTVKLAGKYADKILNFKWVNDFSAARNFSLQNAKHNWVFILDADNEVTDWDENTVGAFIEKNDPRKVGNIEIISVFDEGTDERKNSERENKLFNRQYFRYKGIIHEQVEAIDGGSFDRIDVDISELHLGYKNDEIKRKNKAGRNTEMIKLALEQEGDSCYLLYQLGKSYDLDKNYSDACKYYSKAISLIDNLEYLYVCKLIIAYGYALVNIGDYKAAMVIEKYHSFYINNPDYNFLLAYVYMMNAMFSKAVETFLKCTEQKGGEIEGITSWLPLYNIGVIYECLGKRDEAIKYYGQCGNYEQAKNRIAALLQK